MKAENFCYWMQSSFELCDVKSFNEKQTELIKKHLAMVFIHEIDPSHGDKEHQGKLSAIHSGMNFFDNTKEDLDLPPPFLPSLPEFLKDTPLHSTVDYKKNDMRIRC